LERMFFSKAGTRKSVAAGPRPKKAAAVI
jgi:hypothetical protein